MIVTITFSTIYYHPDINHKALLSLDGGSTISIGRLLNATAETLPLNETIPGRIGFTNDSSVRNDTDYYKIVLPEDGH